MKQLVGKQNPLFTLRLSMTPYLGTRAYVDLNQM